VLAVVHSSPSGNRKIFDYLVVGSGFSGSLLAWILASQGRSVLLVDRAKHPRFAIGESSTPTADFLVAFLAQRWNLKDLAPLASWGTWKSHYPNLRCGKKRGFSYYEHRRNQSLPYCELDRHSVLVAASSSDAWSDTHWLRSDVDSFLGQHAVGAGVVLVEDATIVEARFDAMDHRWGIRLQDGDGQVLDFQSSWLIDATGPSGGLARWTNSGDDSDWMRTRTSCVFGHFQHVDAFEESAQSVDPFCGDDAAQHHVLDSGWFWMLRFDHGVTSVGWVHPSVGIEQNETSFWNEIHAHPSLGRIMHAAKLVEPKGMGCIERISRCRDKAFGPGWVSLPVSYGFVDPLHSTGIAHALSGVSRLAEIFSHPTDDIYSQLHGYQSDLRNELRWLDTLVAGCYAAQPSFESFYAYACFYFIAAIEFERQLAADPSHWPLGFLQARDSNLRDVGEQAYQLLQHTSDSSGNRIEGLALLRNHGKGFVDQVRGFIKPWNHVGLLDPANGNRIAHSVAPKYAAAISALCD
jgi:FADH2 O2-dependent halogenase